MNMLANELEKTNKNISIMDDEIEDLNKSKLPKNDYNAYMEKFNSIISKRELETGKSESFQKRLQEHEEKRLKIEYDQKILLMNSEEKANFEKTGKIGIYISVILILSGFCLWYIKLQSYQDAILRKQAKTLNNEIDYPSLPIISNKPATSDSLHNEEQN